MSTTYTTTEFSYFKYTSHPKEESLRTFVLMIASFISVSRRFVQSADNVNTQPIEFFLKNTNLIFLAFLYKINIEGFQNQQK